MHLLLYRHSILDAVGLSSFLTVVVFVGAGYGFLSMFRDAFVAIRRHGEATGRPPKQWTDPKPPREPPSA